MKLFKFSDEATDIVETLSEACVWEVGSLYSSQHLRCRDAGFHARRSAF
jgi:hypothetical protein